MKMVKKRGYLYAFFLFTILVVLFTNSASASFNVGNKSHSIDKTYGASESIKGWVNISFSNEPSDSLFQDSRNKSVKLIDLLRGSRSGIYSCSPIDCSTDYGTSNAEVSKTLGIGSGNSKLVGLKFNGVISRIESVNFSIASNATANCGNQLSVDFFDDGVTDIINDKLSASSSCSRLKSYGCYDSGALIEEYKVVATPYCQRINLTKSPGFNIGAWVRRNSGSINMKASVHTLGGTEVANCNLNLVVDGEVSCSINYPITEPSEYYVCISSTGGTGDYKIRGNTNPTKGCGFYGLPPPSSTTPNAYQIFAEGKGFDSVGTINIKNSANGRSLSNLIYDYITRRYGTSDCTNGCIVPIRFSGLDQQVILSGLIANYQKEAGIVTENNFYDLGESPARVSSEFQNFYLDDAGFTVPDRLGIYKFSLKLKGGNLFSEDVNVTDVPKILSLNPTSTASAYPTTFTVLVNSSGAKKFFWDFGDNTTGVTTTNSIRHTYNSTRVYQITIVVTDTKNLSSSKIFEVNVSSPKNLINTTIKKIRSNADRIENDSTIFDSFSKQSIDSVLKIANITKELNKIETRFNSAQSEAEYNQIVTDLLKLNVPPRSISEGKVASNVLFISEKENINLEIVKKFGGGDFDSTNQDSYANAILLWNQENLDTKITFNEFFGNYDGDYRSVVKTFELNIKKKKDISGSYYLVIPKLENLGFESGVVATEYQGNVYIDLSKREKVSLYTTGDVDFTNLPAFISPGFSKLSLADTNSSILKEERPTWMILILAIIFLLIITLVVYIVLQEWYKRKYENYLFKNRNDLYNMVNYVHNSKKKGMKNKEIAKSLKKAKWSSEQITYVMKKYAGERTGMLEIPLFGLSRKKFGEGTPGKNMPDNHKKL